MKAILSLRRHYYLRTFSIFLIAVILIAGVVGCEGEPVQYDLVIDSTAGGEVTDPGEGTFTYDEREVVDLVATPDCGYVFDNWTGDTAGIDDVNAAATNITMSADYSITANFAALPPDHYKLYQVDWEEPVYIGKEVQLVDQFGTFTATVKEAILFGNPVEKDHPGTPLTPISDLNRHYTVYWLDFGEEYEGIRSVEISNQFQENATLSVYGPVALAVPTKKEGHEMVECLNHFLLYSVMEEEFPEVGVNLKDQFIPDGEDVTVGRPILFANPVQKTVVESGEVTEIEDPDEHWVLYDIYDMESPSIGKTIQIANQFGNDQILDLTYRDTLAVPSQKIVPPTPPLDHFKCYPATGPDLGEVYVYLEDQFGYYEAVPVFAPLMFCNPVDKVHGTLTTSSNPDNHLTVYLIGTATKTWTVTVDNQFNDAAVPQILTVTGPVALAVPTQKLEPYYHEKPKYLDHYLLYVVDSGLNVTATVDLDDQFPGTAPGVTVTQPIFFATPAVKGYVDYLEAPWDPEGHLVFYAISDNDEYVSSVVVSNQFQEATLLLDDFNELLAVPSVKVSYEPVL